MSDVTVFQGITPAPSNVTAVTDQPASGGTFYGRAIPVGYGTRRVDGANIWVSPVSTLQVGKTSKQVVDFAVSFGARSAQPGVKTSIVKIWSGTNVLIDKTSETPVRTKGFVYSTYFGSEQQGFDPTIEKWQGKGNTPAYRGQIYIVVRNFSLSDYGSGGNVPTLSAELSDYSTNLDHVLDYTPMPGAPYPEWQDVRIENSNKYYCDWNNNRLVTLGAMHVGDATITNAVRTFDLTTMQELSQSLAYDKPGPPVYFLPGDDPAPPQPVYTGGPFATNQQPDAGLAGPWFLPKSGYAVIVMEDDSHTFRRQTAILDPATGRLLGKVGTRNVPWRMSAVENAAPLPAVKIVNSIAPGA